MRVIAGSARHLQLKCLDSLETRPTTDRIKETLFNMITPHLADAVFLDLFSGSGGIGIEALSRGAKEAVFVENNINAVKYIKDNLMFTKLDKQSKVIAKDAMSGLKELEGKKVFDYIFMDPPYNKELEKEVLSYLTDSSLLDKDGMIIVEASLDTEFAYVDAYGYVIVKIKKYKTNMHVFLNRKEEDSLC